MLIFCHSHSHRRPNFKLPKKHRDILHTMAGRAVIPGPVHTPESPNSLLKVRILSPSFPTHLPTPTAAYWFRISVGKHRSLHFISLLREHWQLYKNPLEQAIVCNLGSEVNRTHPPKWLSSKKEVTLKCSSLTENVPTWHILAWQMGEPCDQALCICFSGALLESARELLLVGQQHPLGPKDKEKGRKGL